MGYHKGAHRVRRKDTGHRSPRQQLTHTSSEKPEMANQGIHPASPESPLCGGEQRPFLGMLSLWISRIQLIL